MIYGYIYKTTNILNQKVYIGQKKGIFKLSYLGSGQHIKNAIKKHGTRNFRVDLLTYASSREMLNAFEIQYIADYRKLFPGEWMYNIANGGIGGMAGHSESTKQKIKEARKRQIFTSETRIKMSISRKGRIITPETREKLRVSNVGKKHNLSTQAIKNISSSSKRRMIGNKISKGIVMSAEAKNKISLSLKGRKLTQEHKNRISIARKKFYEVTPSH